MLPAIAPSQHANSAHAEILKPLRNLSALSEEEARVLIQQVTLDDIRHRHVTLKTIRCAMQRFPQVAKDTCDFRIIKEGREYPVHRLFLQSESAYFASKCAGKTKDAHDDSLKVPDEILGYEITSKAVADLLAYLESGAVHFDHEDVVEILLLAREYQIDELYRSAMVFLKGSIDCTNASRLLELAIQAKCPDLEWCCMVFMRLHWNWIEDKVPDGKSPRWQELMVLLAKLNEGNGPYFELGSSCVSGQEHKRAKLGIQIWHNSPDDQEIVLAILKNFSPLAIEIRPDLFPSFWKWLKNQQELDAVQELILAKAYVNITPQWIQALGELIRQAKNLETLHLNCNVSSLDGLEGYLQGKPALKMLGLMPDAKVEASPKLLRGLLKNSSLTAIQWRKLTPDEGRAFADLVAKHPTLSRVTLQSTQGLSNKLCKKITTALAQTGRITHLALIDCQLSSKQASILGQAIGKNNSLVELDLSDNRDIGEEGSVAIARGLTDNRSIKKIKLRRCALSSEFGKAFGQALAANSTLSEFDLHHNPLGIEGTKGIAEGMKRNASVEEFKSDYHLILSERHIGFEALADLIAQNTNVRKLVVTCGPCSPESLFLLSEALKCNTNLEHLELQQVQPTRGVDEDLLHKLAEALKSHPVLHTVILNEITIMVNAIALFADLTANPSITHLDLSKNPLDKEGLAAFAQALKKNVGLRSLCLEFPENVMAEDFQDFKRDVFSANPNLKEIVFKGRFGERVVLSRSEALATLKRIQLG